MFSLNRIQLVGYLTRPVSIRQTPNGRSVCDLNIASPYTFTSNTGQELSGTAFHSVTAWGGMADVAAQYLKPGGQVFISGRLQTDSWEDTQSGEKRNKTQIVAMDLILLDPKGGQLELDSSAKPLANCLNRADVIGNLTKDPELRTTTNGQSVVSFGVATNESWKDRQTNEIKERAEFHNVVVWGDLAQVCTQNLKKGMRVHAAGRVQTRSWETQAGAKRYTTEVIAENVSILGAKNTDINYSNEGPAAASSPTQKEVAPVAANTAVPEVKYESEVKVEDLPF
ncbi:single-stranded DNA-binding protein [Candidatus Peribacteria bacterium]|jgi:single-strand DNA-binding protein|nr:single-stranded DNA-binding protein [Candidatus Peribacteria bacterium]MBT4020991.1 single-stranded DNA-binding protein [Candidatus Peribacteria bacterium]MBT4240890.1 single-stranded DNA-binding protein [Candidatus Peribacteria bacterium]MBT4474113.1 single-stranded DNA-binding protein [Candidatus Peribacteria bacterium]